MAEKEKKSFPMLPVAHWWALRDKFRQSIPGVVTDTYLAAALNMQAQSARANVLPYLRDVGLIDEDGKTLPLAKEWRDDSQYAAVCGKMLEHVYPEELRSAAPDATVERGVVERWFANHTGAGTSAVRRMTQFFFVLLEADVTKKPTSESRPTRAGKTPRTKSAPANRTTPAPRSRTETTHPTSGTPPVPSMLPGVSINLQIHISADATPDQIDKIFESMAKHIYKK
jgi:hypothetical protein